MPPAGTIGTAQQTNGGWTHGPTAGTKTTHHAKQPSLRLTSCARDAASLARTGVLSAQSGHRLTQANKPPENTGRFSQIRPGCSRQGVQPLGRREWRTRIDMMRFLTTRDWPGELTGVLVSAGRAGRAGAT